MIKIEQATNGWILTDEDEDGDGNIIEHKIVFSYDDEAIDESTIRKNEVEAFKTLLYALNNRIGVPYSKHQAYNIKIDCEKYD